MESAVASSNEFSLKLLNVCRNATPGENLFYSPASISTCLSMLQTGAKGETRKQIEDVLNIGEETHFWILSRYLQNLSGPIALKTSNIIAVDDQNTILPEFVDNLKLNYHSEIKKLPFRSDPDKSREEINRLIEAETNGKIRDMFGPSSINNDARLVLANAIYFMGKWKDKFLRCFTKRMPFYGNNGEKSVVHMMCKMESYKYTNSEELNADLLEIPYRGATVSLIILLPSERYGLPFLENAISVENLNKTIREMRMEERIMLGLPKFKTGQNISLTERLLDLGITEAFTNHADFSGISTDKKLYVSSVLHKTLLEINEQGTVAAASTGVEVVDCCRPPPPRIRFMVDHPFMMFIRESTTGLILFLGSIQKV